MNGEKMTLYRRYKANAEYAAVEWQNNFSNENYSYSELAEIGDYFYKIGKRYGLLTVFRENGII